MIPFLFLDIPVSTVELNKPKIECVSCITTIENIESKYLSSINRLLEKELNICDYLSNIGTTIMSNTVNKLVIFDDVTFDFFSDNYDIIVKMPNVKTISKKVKIQTISKFKPKIIIYWYILGIISSQIQMNYYKEILSLNVLF